MSYGPFCNISRQGLWDLPAQRHLRAARCIPFFFHYLGMCLVHSPDTPTLAHTNPTGAILQPWPVGRTSQYKKGPLAHLTVRCNKNKSTSCFSLLGLRGIARGGHNTKFLQRHNSPSPPRHQSCPRKSEACPAWLQS